MYIISKQYSSLRINLEIIVCLIKINTDYCGIHENQRKHSVFYFMSRLKGGIQTIFPVFMNVLILTLISYHNIIKPLYSYYDKIKINELRYKL